MATLADLQALQQRQQLAQMMSMQRPMGNNQGARAAAGIGALVSALAANKIGNQVKETQGEIQSSDMAILGEILKGGGDPSRVAQIQDPNSQRLALAFLGQKPDSPYAPISGVGVFNKQTGEITTGPQYRSPEEEVDLDVEKTRRIEEAKNEADEAASKAEALKAQPELETANDIFVQTISDPNFSGAVGMMDQFTGAIGAQFGTEEGILGQRVNRLASSLVLKAAESMKGALSDRDIKFLQDSAPSRSDSEEVWKDWYSTEYLPRVNAARKSIGVEALPDPFAKKGETDEMDQDVPEGTIIQNTAGETLILQNGEWVPHNG